jgi:hypothetical protein
VLVLEKMPSCGKKLLLTGLGQCNITNDSNIRSFSERYGQNGAFLRPALLNFTNLDLIAFFEEHGVPMITGESGKVFPRSRRASDILDLLLSECRTTGVEIRCNEGVQQVTVQNDQSFAVTSIRASYRATDLVIATGGASYPSTGSTGDGYRLAESLGHTIATPAPALAPLYPENYPFFHLAGISFQGTILTLYRQGKKMVQLCGDLLFTHTGLSGPGILHLSRYTEAGDELRVGFLPERSAKDITREFVVAASSDGQRPVQSYLTGYDIPARFVESILRQAGIPETRTLAHLTKPERDRLVLLLTAYPFRMARVGGYEEAMVTRGGVSLREVDPKTMESRIRHHLYIIGEVLNVDGDTGGYNLQAAFSTAESAARAILAK